MRGSLLYVAILAELFQAPGTAIDLARRVGMRDPGSAQEIMRRMHGRLAHIADYVSGPCGNLTRLWAFGPGPDAPVPAAWTPRQMRVAPEARAELAAFIVAIEFMQQAPRSIAEISAASGHDAHTLYPMVRALHDAKLLRIGDWDRERACGAFTPCWEFAPGQPDASKPARMTRRQIERRYWEARRAKAHARRITVALAAANDSTYSAQA